VVMWLLLDEFGSDGCERDYLYAYYAGKYDFGGFELALWGYELLVLVLVFHVCYVCYVVIGQELPTRYFGKLRALQVLITQGSCYLSASRPGTSYWNAAAAAGRDSKRCDKKP